MDRLKWGIEGVEKDRRIAGTRGPLQIRRRCGAARRRSGENDGVIVTCEQCSTSFQLDESRIPASGARVRCSRCKHAFFLENPSVSRDEALHAVAAEAAADPGLAPAEDLTGGSWDGLGGAPVSIGGAPAAESAPAAEREPSVDPAPSPSPASSADPQPSPSPASLADPQLSPSPELDEEDWQFSEEVRIEGDEPDDDSEGPFAEGVDADLSSSGFGEDPIDARSDATGEPARPVESESDFGTGLDTSTFGDDLAEEAFPLDSDGGGIAPGDATGPDAGSGLELDAPSVTSESVRDESSFGTVEDFSRFMEDEAAPESPGADPVSELADDLRAELQAPPPTSYASGGQTDDLGDPESWDLVGSDDPVARTAPLGATASLPAIEAEDFFGASSEAETSAGDLASSALAKGPIGRLMRMAGWLATLATIGFVLQLAFTAEVSRWAQRSTPVIAGPLEATIRGSGWVDTARSGAVLRIEGEIRNVDERSHSVGIVRIVPLDVNGFRIDAPPVRVGLPIAEPVLREAPPDVLGRRAGIAADRFLAAPLAPGEIRRFEALVPEDRLPKQAARIALELLPPGPDQRGAP